MPRSSLTSGKKVDTQRATTFATYDVGGRSGRPVLEFVTEEAGRYRINCGYEEGSQGPEAVRAIGSGVTEGILGMILKCFAAVFGGGIVGGGILVTVYV